MTDITDNITELTEWKLFESYLEYQHAQDYTGTDDNMIDAFMDWVGDLEEDEIIDYMHWFLKAIDKKISSINWWTERKLTYPKS